MQFIFILSTLVSIHVTASIQRTDNKTNKIDLGFYHRGVLEKKENQSQEQNHCLLCSRLGTVLLPDIRPLPSMPGYTCGDAQNSEAAIVTNTSYKCEQLHSMYETRCCDQFTFPEYYECATNVRSQILNHSYDATVPPIHGSNGTMGVLQVDTLVTFIAVKNLNIKTSTLELFVDISMIWNDPRLRWDFNGTNCVSSVKVRANPSVEETEIWVPSLDLLNRATSVQNLPSNKALLKHDGTVEWGRLGSLTAICSFTGLRRMPFDDLGCRLIFGDNEYDIFLIDYKLREMGKNRSNGFEHSNYTISYAEFTAIDEKSETGYLSIWNSNTFYIDLYFHRAQYHYFLFTILPNILFTYMSFGQFAFDVNTGERLTFSITIVLITVAQSIVTATLLPICNEKLWLNSFNLVSMMFTLAGIFETIAIFILLGVLSRRQNKICEEKEEEKEYESLVFNATTSLNQEEDDDCVHQQQENAIETKEIGQLCDNASPDLLDTERSQHEAVTDLNGVKKLNSWRDIKLIGVFTTKLNGISDLTERMDLVCLHMLPLAYTIFIIVMFVTNSQWSDDPVDSW